MYLVGYELLYDCPLPTPMIFMLNIHSTRASDIVVPDRLITNPCIPDTSYDIVGSSVWWAMTIVAAQPPAIFSAPTLQFLPHNRNEQF